MGAHLSTAFSWRESGVWCVIGALKRHSVHLRARSPFSAELDRVCLRQCISDELTTGKLACSLLVTLVYGRLSSNVITLTTLTYYSRPSIYIVRTGKMTTLEDCNLLAWPEKLAFLATQNPQWIVVAISGSVPSFSYVFS